MKLYHVYGSRFPTDTLKDVIFSEDGMYLMFLQIFAVFKVQLMEYQSGNAPRIMGSFHEITTDVFCSFSVFNLRGSDGNAAKRRNNYFNADQSYELIFCSHWWRQL